MSEILKQKFAVTRCAALLAVGLLAGATAGAQGVVNARVLSATPLAENVPVQDCGAYGGAGRPSGAGTAVGALVGGLLGSQLGSGSGHIAGAILGTVGSAMLGNAADARAGYYGGCATRYEQRVTGYDVAYEWGGRQYRTRTAQPPGQWLQVPAPQSEAYPAPGYGYGDVQSYPVDPPPVAAYPLPAYPAAGEASGVVTAPPVAYGGYPAYPAPYPQAYPQAYPAPYPPRYPQAYPQYPVQAYPQPVVPAPVYVRPAPVYAAPIGINLSVGGVFGGRRHGGWGVGIGTGF